MVCICICRISCPNVPLKAPPPPPPPPPFFHSCCLELLKTVTLQIQLFVCVLSMLAYIFCRFKTLDRCIKIINQNSIKTWISGHTETIRVLTTYMLITKRKNLGKNMIHCQLKWLLSLDLIYPETIQGLGKYICFVHLTNKYSVSVC